jgi:hypothetical protein
MKSKDFGSSSWVGYAAYYCSLVALSFGAVTAVRYRTKELDASYRPEQTSNDDDIRQSPYRIAPTQIAGLTGHGPIIANEVEANYNRLDELLALDSRSSLAEAGCIICILANKDPERVLAYLISQGWEKSPTSLKTLLVDVWAEKSCDQALVAIQGCQDKSARIELEFRLLHSLSRVDPARAFKIWSRNSEKIYNDDRFKTSLPEYEIFNNWARTDPNAAIAAIEEIQGVEMQETARRAFVVGLSVVDLDQALQYIKSLPNSASQRSLLAECFDERRKLEPASDFSSLSAIHEILDERDADQFLVDMTPKLIRDDPKNGLECLLSFDKSSKQLNTVIASALKEAGMTYGQSVVEALEKAFPDLKGHSLSLDTAYAPFIGAYVNAVASQDAKIGLELLERNPGIYETAVNLVLPKVFEKNPGEAMKFLAGRVADEQSSQLASRLLDKWSVSSPQEAIEWARNYMPKTTTVAQDLYLKSLAPLIAENPAAYVDSLAEIAPAESHERSSAYWRLVNSWVAKDPEQAAAWVENIKDEELEGQMVDALTTKWTKTDPLSASRWIKSLPVGKNRDIAVQNLIDEIHEADPKSAEEWLKYISK